MSNVRVTAMPSVWAFEGWLGAWVLVCLCFTLFRMEDDGTFIPYDYDQGEQLT